MFLVLFFWMDLQAGLWGEVAVLETDLCILPADEIVDSQQMCYG